MFRRERERENRDLNGGPPVGQIRVLVAGDSGVGKTSLVHLIMKGSSIAHPTQTVGCTVSVKHVTHPSGSSSNGMSDDSERGFFVELWDVSGHERYKDCRSLFYSQINGVILVHDLSQKRTKTSLHKWAAEIASTGTFSAPMAAPGPGGLCVPYFVIGNKADIASKEMSRGSSGNLVDAARQWVEKQGLLAPSEDLPLTDSFASGGNLVAAAKEGRYDKEAVMKFFRTLIKRRYFSDELPGANPWSSHMNTTSSASREIVSEYDQLYRNTSYGDELKHNVLPPLPAQRNLTPPPTLYPQHPMSTIPNSYSIPQFAFPSSLDGTSVRSKRLDLNV